VTEGGEKKGRKGSQRLWDADFRLRRKGFTFNEGKEKKSPLIFAT